jgi:alcohol dehydrogenase (cytochrome c)
LSVWSHSYLKAIDYRTGNVRWSHDLGPGENWSSVLSTAGGIVFTADNHGNILGLEAQTGRTLWHTYGGGMAKGPPITYELDGRQYLLVGSQEVLYCFALPQAGPAN